MLITTDKARTATIAQEAREIQVELFRKTIHLLVAVVPFLAAIDLVATLAVLGVGTIVYSYAELLRVSGRPVFLISQVTVIASRQRDVGHFVLGPVTLGLGAMLALMLYPEPAAAIAIYALAFGDSFSSLIGKIFGRIRIPLTGGKTLAGSAACFAAVYLVTYGVTGNPISSVIIAAAATVFEVLPTKDLDNIILPLGTGFIASQLLSLG